MSLGRLLRRTEIKRETGRVFLVDVLDRQIVKSRPVFGWKHVFSIVKEMNRMLVRRFNRDEFWRLFQDLNDAVFAPPHRADGIFHPSSLRDDCPRKLHYEMAGVPFSDSTVRRIPAQLQRTFDVGTWWHTYIQNMLHRAGVLEEAERKVENKARRLYGHTDGRLCFVAGFPKDAPRFTLEIKTINSMGYRKIQSGPYDYHLHQASIYAHEDGTQGIYFIYVNKDTSEITEHLVPIDTASVKEAHDKIDYVLATVLSNFPPKRVCPSSSVKRAIECGYCTHCFKDAR